MGTTLPTSHTRQPGYTYLRTYQMLVIIFDLTDKFCKIHLLGPEHRRTREQMFQAARSSKQCLVEGYTQESLKGYIYLVGISHGSNEELRHDYQDFLRHRHLPIWPSYIQSSAKKVGSVGHVGISPKIKSPPTPLSLLTPNTPQMSS